MKASNMNIIENIYLKIKTLTPRQIIMIIILILSMIFLFNLFKSNKTGHIKDSVVKDNIKFINNFDYSNVSKVESQLEKEGFGKVVIPITKSNKKGKISKAKYKEIFSNSIIVGDSITEGLTSFGFLNADQVFFKVGGSISKGESQFNSAASVYPKMAFFTFGMNDMGNYRGDDKAFISDYKKLLDKFHKKSPKTKIFINSISTPSSKARNKNHSLKNYKKFNAALRKMCEELDIPYIDNNYILEENPDFYASDGIHVSPGYYNKWLNNMILKAGL